MTHYFQQMCIWITRKLPVFLILEPERVFIGFAALVLGISSFWPPATAAALSNTYNALMVFTWGVLLSTGGTFKLMGLYMSSRVRQGQSVEYEQSARLAERTGASLIALGCLIYAVAVIRTYGYSAPITAVVFIVLAGANLTRVVISTAGRTILDNQRGNDDNG